MVIIDKIFSFIWDISAWFKEAYLTVSEWIWPFSNLAEPLYIISDLFWRLLTPIAQFHDWVANVEGVIQTSISWDTIKDAILDWLPNLESVVTWWQGWETRVGELVLEWWGATSLNIKEWISIATEGFSDLVIAWNNFWTITWLEWITNFSILKTTWDSFLSEIYPTLVDWTTLNSWWNNTAIVVQRLMEDTIKAYFPFYDNLANLWDSIAEFFADPEQYVYKKLDSFFEKFW